MSKYTDKICPIIYSSNWTHKNCFGEECAWFSKCYNDVETFNKVVPNKAEGEWVEEFSDDGWKWVKDES